MKLHLSSEFISIHIEENSPYYAHIKHTLTQLIGRSFWIQETLINFNHDQQHEKRRAFLHSLYNICAVMSQTHNASFLQKLILKAEKPIRLIKKRSQTYSSNTIHSKENHYTLLGAHEHESLAIIRKKYLRLAKQFHPDQHISHSEDTARNHAKKFQQIHEAYQLIKTEKKRKLHAA